MSNSFAKGKETAFQRWEMASFGDVQNSSLSRVSAAEKSTQAELVQLRAQVREEAYTAGYKEAYEAGYNEGRQAGYAEMQVEAQRQIQALVQLQNNFSAELAKAHDLVGDDLIALAIDIAEAMTRTQLRIDREAIVAIVQEAIAHLPIIQQPAQIHLHPEDLRVVKELAGQELESAGWKLMSDSHLERGGCKVETAQNLVDASKEVRWARIVSAMSPNSPVANEL
jgi:flagellar assembly protein FliH